MSLFDDLLGRISADSTPPIVGAIYLLKPDGDPFGSSTKVVVLAVKEGWVQYHYDFQVLAEMKWTLKIETFNSVYKKDYEDHSQKFWVHVVDVNNSMFKKDRV